MKEKYIEELCPRWFIFGIHDNGNVDVSDGDGDVVTNVSEELAERMIAARSLFVDGVVAYWMARPDEWTAGTRNCRVCGKARAFTANLKKGEQG